MGATRQTRIVRETKETQIQLSLDLDGTGSAELQTGVPFLDHMLTLAATHGFFDLRIEARGDLHIDAHHTVEDLGICLGKALSEALGGREGIRRYGHAIVPMDEACAVVALDLSNRPYLVYKAPVLAPRVGQFETELVPEFFRAFCQHGGVTLHIQIPHGTNTHHMLEAVFKAWGRALDEATRTDPRRAGAPSSKGSL